MTMDKVVKQLYFKLIYCTYTVETGVERVNTLDLECLTFVLFCQMHLGIEMVSVKNNSSLQQSNQQ